MKRRNILIALLALVLVGVVALQVFPIGTIEASMSFPGNPAVTSAIAWDSPETEAVMRRACYDCHSHETAWYWYTRVAPFSWFVNRDVAEGRLSLNFSEMDLSRMDAQSLLDLVASRLDSDMPPGRYLLLHPEAALDEAGRSALLAGIAATLASYQAETE
jgi:hypothetical protein